MLDSQQSWTDTGLPLTKGKSHIRQVIASSTSVTGREGQSALGSWSREAQPGPKGPGRLPEEARFKLSLKE